MASTAESETPTQRRYTQAVRRKLLLDVVERLFMEHGFSAVTMEDIARAAEVSRPIVYNHFETKEGAYIACVKRAQERYDKELLAAVDPGGTPREQLISGADFFLRVLEHDPGRWLLLAGSASVLPTSYAQELTALRQVSIETIAQLLRRTLVKASEQRIVACAYAVSGIGESLGHWWIANPEMRRQELLEHYAEIVWDVLKPYVEDET